MKKKYIFTIIFIILLCSIHPFAIAKTNTKTDKSKTFDYHILKDGTLEIDNYRGNAKELIIPEKLDGKKVTKLGPNIFIEKELTKIQIPDSVSFETNIFASCRFIKTVIVSPNHPHIEIIDGVIFNKETKTLICHPSGMSSESYKIPEGTLTIAPLAFSRNYSLKYLEMPNSIISIGSCAFSECSQLSNISFSNNLEIIEDRAFVECNSIKTITLPDSLTYLGYDAFDGCNSLEAIIVSPDHPTFEIRDNALINKTEKILLYYFPNAESEIYTIPEGIQTIETYAFPHYCYNITEITIPEGVTTINDYAFSGCINLNKLVLPNSITDIKSLGLSTIYPTKLIVILPPNSYAEKYCKDNHIKYEIHDNN